MFSNKVLLLFQTGFLGVLEKNTWQNGQTHLLCCKPFFFSFCNVWSIFSHSLPVDDAGNIEVEINYTNPAPNRKLVRGCLLLLCASHSDMGLLPSYDWLKDTFKNFTTVFVFIFNTACHMPQIRERFVQNIRANVKRNTISDMVTKARK